MNEELIKNTLDAKIHRRTIYSLIVFFVFTFLLNFMPNKSA